MTVGDTITWRLLFCVGLVVPCQALLDLAEAAVDLPDHDFADSPAVPVELSPLDLDLLIEGAPGQPLLGDLTEGLPLLRCVDASQADMDHLLIHQDGDGVTISYANHLAGQGVGTSSSR